MFEILIISAFLGLIPAFIAQSKGRNFALWWFYGWMLFIVAFIHSIVLKPDVKAVEIKALASGDNKKCPHCAELIKAEAKVCRHCGRDVETAATAV